MSQRKETTRDEMCTTCDCDRIAVRDVWIDEADPPDDYPYCAPCAGMIEGKTEFAAPILSDKLIWNLDNTLAQVMAQGIKRLREMNHGFPAGLSEEAWLAILDEMAGGFQQYADAEVRGHDADYEKLNRSLDLLREWFPHLWD